MSGDGRGGLPDGGGSPSARPAASRQRFWCLAAGAAAVLVLILAGLRWRSFVDWYHFRTTFEASGRDADGRMLYRHRRTGILLVRTPAGPRVRFAGEARRGETFERRISERLIFRLLPVRDSGSFEIQMGSPELKAADYSMPVTPPFHGYNHRWIEGWHFRNSDNTGPNEIGSRNVNAPQRERRFAFVLDEEDHRAALEILDRLLHDGKFPPEEQERAREEFRAQETGSGTLTITDLQLGNLVPGKRASIDHLSFEVELALPPGALGRIFYPGESDAAD